MTQMQNENALPGPARRTLAGGENLSTIGDMARLYGVTLRALRFYEDRGLISPYRQGTSRFYDEAAKTRLEIILKGKQLGFTLGQIAALMPADPAASTALTLRQDQVDLQLRRLERKREEIDAAIDELRAAHATMNGLDARSDAA